MQLPKEFIDYTSALFGETLWNRFLNSFTEDAPISIRLNPWKSNKIPPFENAKPIPWCQNAFWLESRPNFTLDPLFHAGIYYVQEAGSMFLDSVLRQYVKQPITALDLCAAPGGKSTLMRATLPEGSIMISNEIDHHRANILAENVIKQGHRDIIVTSNQPKDYKNTKLLFDLILTDVPCSGEGMFRRDEIAIKEWSVQNIKKSQERQRSIIKDIWGNLRVGGLLIYSTCTFNVYENEENIRWIMQELGAEILPVDIKQNWQIIGSLLKDWKKPVYRFIPGTTKSEGLFMAILRKTNKDNLTLNKATSPELVRQRANKTLYVLSDGIPVAKKKGKNIIPSPYEPLLLNTTNVYPQVELSLKDAQKYLHRETLTLPQNTPLGYVIITYQKHPLGFMKNLGDRANNLYPKQWAIKKL